MMNVENMNATELLKMIIQITQKETHKHTNKVHKNKNLEANSSGLINRVLESDLLNLVHWFDVVLQSLAIYSKYSPIARVLDLDSTVGKNLFNYKWTSPP